MAKYVRSIRCYSPIRDYYYNSIYRWMLRDVNMTSADKGAVSCVVASMILHAGSGSRRGIRIAYRLLGLTAVEIMNLSRNPILVIVHRAGIFPRSRS